MDDLTKEKSIRLLKELRDAYQSQLDAGVVSQIQVLIEELECGDSEGLFGGSWPDRILKIIADVVRIATGISELIR